MLVKSSVKEKSFPIYKKKSHRIAYIHSKRLNRLVRSLIEVFWSAESKDRQ